MIIIHAGQSVEIDEGTTLQQFAAANNLIGRTIIVNGTAVSASTILTAYNVIEYSPNGTVMEEARPTRTVDVDLTDFTGNSGRVSVENSVDAIRSRYENDVAISIIRDNQQVDTTELNTGDRIMVMPSGGVKGA